MLVFAVAVAIGIGYLCARAHARARRVAKRPARNPSREHPRHRAPRMKAPPAPLLTFVRGRLVPPSPPQPQPPLPPPSIRRELLSDDPLEQQLLADLRDDPADVATRMVYADLLEQRGELPKASFVRGTDDDDDPSVLLDSSDLAWRAIASRDRVECKRTTCPQLWELLVPSPDDERRRQCFLCKKTVRYVGTIGEERACNERGERAVVDRGGAPRQR